MKWLKRLWRKRTRRRTQEEKDLLQVHQISQEVVRVILSTVGESTLWRVLEKLEKSHKGEGGSDYTSLAEVWLESQAMFDERRYGELRNRP